MSTEQEIQRSATVATAKPEFVAMSRFVIANGMEDEVKAAFRGRPGLVDQAPGFLRMDVLSPLDAPGEIWIMTYWTDTESYRLWHRSHVFHDAHKGIPKGLKLAPGEQKLREFEHVCA
ncbi:MAG: antibiotic biosynthesis monooxygenase [Sulfuritalea sp.]|nr:antibiotic biosynthesis monooxygenase [Sulfuritalea sp.]